jgi:hypothetical protein
MKYGARNLICEYDATRLMAPGGPAASGIYEEASALVHHLSSVRTEAELRPIVFICHEIGGLIVKRALAFSQARKTAKLGHIRSIYLSTYGIIFLATPHMGFSKDVLLLWNQEQSYSPSQFMLSLLYDSDALQEIADQFAPLIKQFAIYNLWERKETKFGETEAYVVDQASAAPSWEDVDQCGIDATHSEMAKFSSWKSPGYRLVLAALKKYIKSAIRTIPNRWEQDCDILQREREHDAVGLLAEGFALHRSPSPMSFNVTELARDSPSSLLKYTSVNSSGPSSDLSTPPKESAPPRRNVHYCVQSRRSEPYFIGRQQQADQLQEQFGATGSAVECKEPKVFVIYGLPGSGKSQFCLKYIENRRDE